MTCSRLKCTRMIRRNGLCLPHWKSSIAQGLLGLTEAATTQEHIRRLHSLQWSDLGIAHRAGVATSSVQHVLGSSQVQRATERAILSVPLVLFDSYKVTLPAVGLQRRREALAWMGWPLMVIAPLAGTTAQAVCNAQKRGQVSVLMLQRFAAVYDEHQGTQGPSEVVAVRARNKGLYPPVAWECVDIDDPDAWPNLTGFDEETVRALIEGFQPEYQKQDLDEAIRRTSYLTTGEQAQLFGLGWHAVHAQRKEAA